MAANQPAFFNTQFFREVDGVLVPAASCQLRTRPAGTPAGTQPTYTTQAGDVPNANPIILDADGRCDLWLDPDLEYLLELLAPVVEGGAEIREWDDVVAAAVTTGTVTSVNGETGVVLLTPDLLDYSGPVADWFTAANVQDALDQIVTRLDAPPAESVTVEDAAALFTAVNVEDALAELAGSSLLPTRTVPGDVLSLIAANALAWQRRETFYSLAVNDGSASTRDVILEAGTWQIMLDSRAYFDTPTGAISATQVASVGGQNVTTTVNWNRTGASGHGYLIHATDVAIGTLVQAARGTVTMSIAAMQSSGQVGKGTIMTLMKVS